MHERRVVVKAFAERYQRGSKGVRGGILGQVVEVTGLSRRYAAWLLRSHGKKVRLGPRWVVVGDVTTKVSRRRRRVYDQEVLAVLKRVWVIWDYACGQRLAPILPYAIEALERHGELVLRPDVRAKLTTMSAATMDRLLASEKKRYALKSRARTKPGTWLRQQIPIRTFREGETERPGCAGVDPVGHDGGNERGDFLFTLTLSDAATGWTERGTSRNKARLNVLAALQRAQARVPLRLESLHSDSGAEFINHHFIAYCRQHGIASFRSRAAQKNDNSFTEQKNWSVARRFKGYARYDSEAALAVMIELDQVLSAYVNFFLPSQKLVSKVRHGAKVSKRYDRAQTPVERVLVSPHVSEDIKRRLRERAPTLPGCGQCRAAESLRPIPHPRLPAALGNR